jgi:hypothetical protein
MRKICFFLLTLVSIACYGQDTIIFHNGKTAEGKVTANNENNVTFIYKGEDIPNAIGKSAIAEVRFGSGRVEQMSPKVDISGEDGWKNVRVVYDKADVEGLKSLGQVEKHSSGTWSFSITGGHFSEKTLMKMKKEAAKRGGCYVLILSSQSKSGGFFSDGHAQMTGEIFTY